MFFEEQEKADRCYIDVRSPNEYLKGHIPGALSLPLLSDEERACVGIAYKEKGSGAAFDLGIGLCGPRLAALVAGARAFIASDPSRDIEVYCWRGGLRSRSVTELLRWGGIACTAKEGGYKRFRRWVLEGEKRPLPLLHVVGGMTGAGKTDLLRALSLQGAQVLDLEALACHRGSAYGGWPGRRQPSQEQFENDLAVELSTFALDKPLWVEDESSPLGSCQIPKYLLARMQESTLFVVQATEDERITRIVEEYSANGQEALISATERLKKALGGERAGRIRDSLVANDLVTAVRQLLPYYDERYRRVLQRRTGSIVEMKML